MSKRTVVDHEVVRERAGTGLLPLATVGTLVGIGSALTGPFISLFLIVELEAPPFAVGAFLLLTHGSMLVVGTYAGRWSDTRAVRRAVLVIGGLSGAVGYLLFAVLRDYWVLLAVGVTFTAVATTQLPQVFAYGRHVMEGSTRAPLLTSALRMLFSFTWIIGAPLGALLISGVGFGWLFGMTAAVCALTAVVSLLWLPEPPVAYRPDDVVRAPAHRAELLLVAVAFVLLQGATSLDALTLPLFVTMELGESTRTAGLVLSLCAALELPLMLGLGALAMRVAPGLLIRVGVVAGAAYYAIALSADSVGQFVAAQALNAVMISAVGSVGISFFQDLAPARPGYATTLYTNVSKVSGMLSGPLLGLGQQFGHRFSYGLCLAMAVSGLVLLLVARYVNPLKTGARPGDLALMESLGSTKK